MMLRQGWLRRGWLRRWVLLGVGLALLFAPATARATGFASGTDAGVEIQSLHYDVTVRGVHAEVVMEVAFSMPPGETTANLWFPLPRDAVIHRADIYLPGQGRWETAETLGRVEGEEAFEDPGDDERLLIQEIGVDLYRARVVSFGGNFSLRVYYAHVLEPRDGDYVLRVAQNEPGAQPASPAAGMEIFLDAGANAWSGASFSGASGEFAPDAGSGWAISYAALSHDIEIILSGGTHVDERTVSWQPEHASWFAGDSTGISHLEESGASAPLLEAFRKPHTHISWLPPLDDYPALRAPHRNVVFVLDISGSMGGPKLAAMKSAADAALASLEPDDFYGLVAFDGGVIGFRDQMSPGSDTSAGRAWVAGLVGGGSTAIGPALEWGTIVGATSPASNRTVDLLLVTDGLPNVGPVTAPAILDMVHAAASDAGREARIFGCGIGYDLDQNLITSLARASGGEATFALSDGEVSTQILQLFERVRSGGLSDAEVRVAGASEVASYTRIFPQRTLLVGATVYQPASVTLDGEAPNGSAMTIIAELNAPSSGDVAFSRIAPPLAAAAWAKNVIRDVDADVESEERVDEVVMIAKTYGIVTRYSSLIALDGPEAYAARGIERIARNEAGIALEPVSASLEDESRIGGVGTGDSTSPPGSGLAGTISNDQASGSSCGFCFPSEAKGGWVLGLLFAAMLVRRRRHSL